MLKTGMNIARFRQHIPLIEEETVEYFKRWGDEGEKGNEGCSVTKTAREHL